MTVKTLPGLHEMIAGDVELAPQIRPVQVEDVLGREQVEVDLESVAKYLADETVLVTGAGGSIGAELCRQIAQIGCKRLILVEQGETALFEIERELVDQRGFPPSVPVWRTRATGRRCVGCSSATRRASSSTRPRTSMCRSWRRTHWSVRNNTLVTRTMAEIAIEFEASRFVLVSTDKAVNPKTVMGQSKALCEWIVEAFGHRPDVPTRFVAVRFGNVLGSSGSVITIFRRQIERGGPVTVTHPEMTRFFMTIPEAVSLIVQAGAIGGPGEVFVLDMGEPVRIVDLARNMIELSGKEPGATSASTSSAHGRAKSSTRSSGRKPRPSLRPATRRSISSRGPRSTRDGLTRGWPRWSSSSTRATRSSSSPSSPR